MCYPTDNTNFSIIYLQPGSPVVDTVPQHQIGANQSQLSAPIGYCNKFQLFLHISIDFHLDGYLHYYNLIGISHKMTDCMGYSNIPYPQSTPAALLREQLDCG